MLSGKDVRDLVDKLTERVVDLENGQGATTHFHTVKPAEIDESFAHKVSADMGPHTAARAPIPVQLTPEKLEEIRTGITPSPETLGAMKEPMTAEEIKAFAEGHKQLGEFYDSPQKIEPKAAVQVKATKDPFNPSPTRKKDKDRVVDQVKKRFQARKEQSQSENPFPAFL